MNSAGDRTNCSVVQNVYSLEKNLSSVPSLHFVWLTTDETGTCCVFLAFTDNWNYMHADMYTQTCKAEPKINSPIKHILYVDNNTL